MVNKGSASLPRVPHAAQLTNKVVGGAVAGSAVANQPLVRSIWTQTQEGRKKVRCKKAKSLQRWADVRP